MAKSNTGGLRDVLNASAQGSTNREVNSEQTNGSRRWDEAVDMTADETPAPGTQAPLTPPVADREVARLSTPTPRPRNEKAPPDLWSTPERVSRYIPTVSTAEQVEYRNPLKFCMKPAFWKKWTASNYSSLAMHLSLQFDPVPFAREHGLPVDEVQQVFSTVVCQPLYDSAEASRRGEEGMAAILDLYNKYGIQSRCWGKVPPLSKKVNGELDSVEEGVVVISGKLSGTKYKLAAQNLDEEDVRYLVKILSERDAQLLWS